MLEQMVALLGSDIVYTFVNSVDGSTRAVKCGKALIGSGSREFSDHLAHTSIDVLIPLRFFVDRYSAAENQGFPMPEPGDRIDFINAQKEIRLSLIVVTGSDDIAYRPSDTKYEVLRVHCRVLGRDHVE